MPSWTTEKSWTVGAVLPASDLNTYLGANVQYLFNILNAAQAQTTGILVQQDADSTGHGLLVYNTTKAFYANMLVDASGNAYFGNNAGKYIKMNASGDFDLSAASGNILNGANINVTSIDSVPFPFTVVGPGSGSITGSGTLYAPSASSGTWLGLGNVSTTQSTTSFATVSSFIFGSHVLTCYGPNMSGGAGAFPTSGTFAGLIIGGVPVWTVSETSGSATNSLSGALAIRLK